MNSDVAGRGLTDLNGIPNPGTWAILTTLGVVEEELLK